MGSEGLSASNYICVTGDDFDGSVDLGIRQL